MSYGLRVRDANNKVVLDTSTRAGLLHRRVDTFSVNGSYTVPLELGGQVFAAVCKYSDRSRYFCEPSVTVNGRVVSWVYSPKSYQSNTRAEILIGTF